MHIGMPKSASTSLQLALNKMSEKLRYFNVCVAEGGYYEGGEIAPSLALANYVLRKNLDTNFRRLNNQLYFETVRKSCEAIVERAINSIADTVVFSHEALSFVNSTEELERLSRLFSARDILFVCVVRNQSRLRTSYQKQVLYDNNNIMPDLPADSCRYCGADSWVFDSERLIELFSSFFGRENLRVVEFEENSNNLPKIWSACELPESLLNDVREIHVNTSREKELLQRNETLLDVDYFGARLYSVNDPFFAAIPKSAGSVDGQDILDNHHNFLLSKSIAELKLQINELGISKR